MNRVKVVHPRPLLTAGQWLTHLASSPLIAVLEERDEHLLGALLAQLGPEPFITAVRGVQEALKRVEGGFVVASYDRESLVEAVPPFAFRRELAQPLLQQLDDSAPVDLLVVLTAVAIPLQFRSGSDGS